MLRTRTYDATRIRRFGLHWRNTANPSVAAVTGRPAAGLFDQSASTSHYPGNSEGGYCCRRPRFLGSQPDAYPPTEALLEVPLLNQITMDAETCLRSFDVGTRTTLAYPLHLLRLLPFLTIRIPSNYQWRKNTGMPKFHLRSTIFPTSRKCVASGPTHI